MSKYNLCDTDYQFFFPENLKKYKNTIDKTKKIL